MKKFSHILLFLLCLVPFASNATDPVPIIRRSIFSTSTDWEAVTGIYLSQFDVEFSVDKHLVNNGLELYFLDGFPCFAQTDSSRIWIDRNNKNDNKIRLTCLFAPKTVYFAWRNAARDASQDKTTGILECPVSFDNNLKIDLSKCTKGKDWKEYR
jgi:hypothetical protein